MAERTLAERLRAIAEPRFSPLLPEEVTTLREAAAALERLEALEDELRLCRSFHEVAVRQRDSAWAEARALREYYDAAEQAEYAGRQLGTAAQAQAARRLEIARAALRATPAPAPQQGGPE